MVTKTAVTKTGFFERVSKFVRGAITEFKKVHWPTKPELATYTVVVLVAVLIVAVLLWIFDSVFSLLLSKIFLR